MTRRMLPFVAIVAVLLMGPRVQAGGGGHGGHWPIVTLDSVPADVRSGVVVPVTFTVSVRGEGSPNADLAILTAKNPATGETFFAEASRDAVTGRFRAEATFPSAGTWRWGVISGSFPVVSFDPVTVLPAAGKPVSIDIRNFAFGAPRLEAPAGTTITWTNQDSVAHTVSSDDMAFADSGPLGLGQSFSRTFDVPGTYAYRCGPHSAMTGTIVIT